MSRWSCSLDDSDESLSDYQTGLNNVFSVDQLVAVNDQVIVEEEDKEESVDSSSFGGTAMITNLHDANELSALSTSTNSKTALSTNSQTESTVEELDEEEISTEVEEKEAHEVNETVEEEYASDFEPSEECEERIDMTTTSCYSQSTLQENNTEKKIEDLPGQPNHDHLYTTHCCSVYVQTDPIPNNREVMRTITSCPRPLSINTNPEGLVQDMLYSQLELTRQLMEQSLQHARSLTTTVSPSYHYTTLQETKKVCLCVFNRSRVQIKVK